MALLALLGAGCSSLNAASAGGPEPSTAAARVSLAPPPVTLLLDCQPVILGTTVRFQRIPTAAELADATHLEPLERVVLELPGWPEGFAELQPLDQAPRSLEIVVVLPGYPPGPRQAEAWNLLRVRPRLIVVARGAPEDRATVTALNAMRGLERVVVWTEEPRTVHLDRLAVPVSFQVPR
jgi:hypothetical protein